MKSMVVLADEINGSKSFGCKLLMGEIKRMSIACNNTHRKQTIDNDWQTSDAISTGRKVLSLAALDRERGNQIKPNEVKWLQLHSYRFRAAL